MWTEPWPATPADLADLLIGALDTLTADADFEPSLGSLGGTGRSPETFDQRRWADGDRSDLEEQSEGEGEPEFEGCTWPDEGDQTHLGPGW